MTDERVEWHCIADLMTVLMVLFLFISVILIGSVSDGHEGEPSEVQIKDLEERIMALEKRIKESDHVIEKQRESIAQLSKDNNRLGKDNDLLRKEIKSDKEIDDAYWNYNKELREALEKEFPESLLEEWEATIESGNIFRFNSPRVLFESESSVLTQEFKKILDEFCPSYLALLYGDQFRDKVQEIRIEGHTSSAWLEASFEERYLNNADLSQRRAYTVLEYCFKTQIVGVNKEWLTEKLRANGLAFANLIYDENGKENPGKSRRVEFRVITTEERLIGN